jgi:hypothetical protein
MPFCRKCGRRLPEYSESCPDCGQSTTAPMISTKRIQSSHSPNGEVKIIKAARPEAVPVIKIKVAPKKPVKVVTPVKAVAPVKVASTKLVTAAQLNAPIKVATPPKPTEEHKPVLSSKHIVKPKKAKETKPATAFSINFARPFSGLEAPQRKPTSQPSTRKPVAYAAPPVEQPVIQPEPLIALVQPVAEPQIAPRPVQAAIATPTFQSNPVSQHKWAPKPVIRSEPLAVLTIEPHEIIKSNVSLKDDIINNPNDYEKQSFNFDLKCPNGHYWSEGELLPVSKGIAFCLKCGDRLSKPKSKKRRRRQKFP